MVSFKGHLHSTTHNRARFGTHSVWWQPTWVPNAVETDQPNDGDYDYPCNPGLKFNSSISRDISHSLGVLHDSITLRSVQAVGQAPTETQVSFYVGSRSGAEGAKVKNLFEARVKAGTMYVPASKKWCCIVR